MIYIIVVMNAKTSVEQLEREIETIKQKLQTLGPMHPGSISMQYQACGNPACRCLHPTKPQKHGPYHKLAYVYRGKRICRFVRSACVEDLKPKLAAYKTFRALTDKWIELSIKRGIIAYFAPEKKTKARKPN